MPGALATIGFDHDGVKATEFPIVREGILVGLQTNRETAPLVGDKASKGCVRLEPGPKGSPTADEIIADTKDGVLIEARQLRDRSAAV